MARTPLTSHEMGVTPKERIDMPNSSSTTMPIATRLPTDVYEILEARAKKSGIPESEVRKGVNIRARNIIVKSIRHDIGRDR